MTKNLQNIDSGRERIPTLYMYTVRHFTFGINFGHFKRVDELPKVHVRMCAHDKDRSGDVGNVCYLKVLRN